MLFRSGRLRYIDQAQVKPQDAPSFRIKSINHINYHIIEMIIAIQRSQQP